MNITSAIADKIVDFIKGHDEDSSSREVLKYSLIPKIDVAISGLFVLIICSLTNHFLDGLIALLGFTILRYNSGGLHFQSELLCNIVSSLMILSAVYTPISFWYYGFILNIISGTILLLFAPSHSKRDEITDQKLIKKLKYTSLLIVAFNFLLQSHVLSVAFFIQSITTLRFVQKFVDRSNI